LWAEKLGLVWKERDEEEEGKWKKNQRLRIKHRQMFWVPARKKKKKKKTKKLATLLEKRRRRKGEKTTLIDSSEKAKTESKNRENTTHKMLWVPAKIK
jgi:hypothetical protein